MNQIFSKVLKTVLVCFFVLTGFNGCKTDYNSSIPYIHVDFNVNPTNIIELNIPGGSFYFANIGYGGLIVFRDLTDSSNPFLAFDATCTYEVSATCKIKASDSSGKVKCPCCGSEFILFGGNGSVIKGPATEPLKQYHTYYTGGLINIRN
jgi:Rieske Fe-S protein